MHLQQPTLASSFPMVLILMDATSYMHMVMRVCAFHDLKDAVSSCLTELLFHSLQKMQTLTAPSTTWAETKTLFDCSTDVLGLRNLLSELGHLQEGPTIIYQDNKSAIQIATNRGSLGKTSRAMDLQTLSVRDRIEDHLVFPEYLETDRMIADMGSKALPETPFIKFRDVMN